MAGSRLTRRALGASFLAGAGALYMARGPIEDLFAGDLAFERLPACQNFDGWRGETSPRAEHQVARLVSSSDFSHLEKPTRSSAPF